MNRKLHILILEDVPTDAELMQYELRKAGIDFESRTVETKADFVRQLQDFAPDVILCDYLVGPFNGMAALETVRKTDPDIPLIFVSGAIGEERAIETLTSGATDYVLKDNLKRLGPAVYRALREAKTRHKRRMAEETVRTDRIKLRSLTAQLQTVEEKQRREFAVELHDSLSQVLAFAKIELGTLQQKVCPELSDSVRHVRDLIDEVIAKTRKLTFDMSPATLYSLGLEPAIEELAELYNEEEIFNCKFEKTEHEKPLTERVKILLYRAVRELLVNTAKHAKAKNVTLSSKVSGDSIELSVTDDGVGFEPSLLKDQQNTHHSFGLFSIRQRLDHLGGNIDIASQPGDGTTVTLRAPLRRK